MNTSRPTPLVGVVSASTLNSASWRPADNLRTGRNQIVIGGRYGFRYPNYGTPDQHPDYTAHSGQVVTVIRQLDNSECDPQCQPMYEIKASDGWTGHAHASELGSIKVKLYANLPGSPTTGEDRVRITSRFGGSMVYVSRLVKSSGKFGKRRYLIDQSIIRREETA